MKKKIYNLIFPFKNEVEFKWQDKSKQVVWMFLKVEKSLITKDYKIDSYKEISQPINRFNIDSPFGQTIRNLYNIDYKELEDFI